MQKWISSLMLNFVKVAGYTKFDYNLWKKTKFKIRIVEESRVQYGDMLVQVFWHGDFACNLSVPAFEFSFIVFIPFRTLLNADTLVPSAGLRSTLDRNVIRQGGGIFIFTRIAGLMVDCPLLSLVKELREYLKLTAYFRVLERTKYYKYLQHNNPYQKHNFKFSSGLKRQLMLFLTPRHLVLLCTFINYIIIFTWSFINF